LEDKERELADDTNAFDICRERGVKSTAATPRIG
jgi:hypothetical protein